MIEVESSLCDLCGTCVGVCDAEAICIKLNELRFDSERCVLCLGCIKVCPVGALKEKQ